MLRRKSSTRWQTLHPTATSVQLAKPGYDQLKAWLMMARPDKVDGAFYAQT
jgi:type VI protein secretion system component VasK